MKRNLKNLGLPTNDEKSRKQRSYGLGYGRGLGSGECSTPANLVRSLKANNPVDQQESGNELRTLFSGNQFPGVR